MYNMHTRQGRRLIDVHAHGLTIPRYKCAAGGGLDFDFLSYRRGRSDDRFDEFGRNGLFARKDFSSMSSGLLLGDGHPVLPKYMLSLPLDLCNTFHGLDRCLDQVAVVAHWDVSALFEINGRIYSHFLSGGLTEGFSPSDLSWVALHLEVLMTF